MRYLFVILAFTLSIALPAAAQDFECPGAPAPRLTYSAEARVLPGAPNRIRFDASTQSEILGEIPAGETFYVGSGPVCSEEMVWWYINYNGIVGWTAEGSGDDYFIEPVTDNVVSTIGDTETTVEFSGVSFAFPNTLGVEVAPINVSGILVPEEIPTEDSAYWTGNPEYIEFKFDTYDATHFHTNAYIRVFPTAEFTAINEYAGEQITSLETLLASDDDIPTAEPLPFLPIFNAGQIIRAQVEPLSFENGSGIRYVTFFAQDVYPVINTQLVYTFQGLTTDGEYYVSVFFPLRSDILPDEIGDDFDFEAFVEIFESYLAETEAALDDTSDDSFSPTLTDLDALVQSLTVEPAAG